MITNNVHIRWLGLQNYQDTWQAMKQFTLEREPATADEIWLLEHEPVFTQGQNGKAEHILDSGNIPVIHSDRGGQVTYHGPGQLMIYTLIDLKRKNLNIREFVSLLEDTIIQFLENHGIIAFSKREAPGVYVNNEKICSIGLRVKRNCTYHGIAFNIAMDLEPFNRINPCGFSELKMTQLCTLAGLKEIRQVAWQLANYLTINLKYLESVCYF